MKSIKRISVFLVVVFFHPSVSFAQTKMRKLSNNLNHPSFNTYAPFLSADANAIIFLSDNAEDNMIAPFYSSRDNNDWKEPQMLPKSIYTRLNFLKGFALNADGKKMFFTSFKMPSVGGYDIWMSELKGSTWSEPTNLGMPVNTKGNEACPSISSDGNSIYFTRCEKMNSDKAEGCKIFRTDKKPNGQWGDPVELPATINTGNSQTPRIMADGQMLIFSSDKFPGNKGGMDLYSSTLKNGNWSNPVPWDFINTDKDDQYVSIAALGRYIVKDAKGLKRNEMNEYLIPDNLRPKGMMKLDGKILDPAGKPIPTYISIIDLTTNKRYYSGRPYADGTFIVYVMEGTKYELAIEGEQDNLTYFSKQLDLTSDKIPQVEKISATIKPLSIGDELPLNNIKFKPYTSELDTKASALELDRLARVAKGNPGANFEIQVLLNGFMEDSVQSDPDLTEVVIDSIQSTYDDIDSLGQLFKRDTVYVETRYHNDRTQQQASSIVNYFVSKGIPSTSFTIFTNAIPALPENRAITIKAVAKAKK